MPTGMIGPQGVTTITPPARERLTKVAKISASDAGNAFAAFGLPKYAFIAGVYIISTGAANATQTITAGFTDVGTEILTAVGIAAPSFAQAGAYMGSAVGTVLTADKTVYVKASAAVDDDVYVLVDYWVVPVGNTY